MKKILIYWAALFFSAVVFFACEKYEDGKPQKNVREAFAEMYPDARDVEWDAEGGLWVVSFELGTPPNVVEYEVWYDVDGNCLRIVTDK